MTRRTGQFVWRELMTSDLKASQAFYEAQLGWTSESMPMPDGTPYVMHCDNRGAQGGYVELAGPETAGVPPHWMPFVSVDDLDATVARVKASGGSVHVGPMDVGAGSFAVIQDPTGAWITAWRSQESDGEAHAMEPGAFCWETLHTTDIEASVAFYGEVFGWRRGDFHGSVTLLAGETAVADVQAVPAPGIPSYWLSHVAVEDLDATVRSWATVGGAALSPPIPVPTVGTLQVLRDPQGAVISLVQPEGS